jgi:hypothetical protein
MKAQTVFTIVALTLMAVVFTLGATGEIHPFSARALVAIVVAVWAFLALLPYHKEGNK